MKVSGLWYPAFEFDNEIWLKLFEGVNFSKIKFGLLGVKAELRLKINLFVYFIYYLGEFFFGIIFEKKFSLWIAIGLGVLQ